MTRPISPHPATLPHPFAHLHGGLYGLSVPGCAGCWVGDRESYCEKPVHPPLPSRPQEQRGNAVLDPEDQPGGCHLLSALLPCCRQLHEEVLSASVALLHYSPLPGTSSWAHDATSPGPSFSSVYPVPGPGVRDKSKEQTFSSIPPPTPPLTHRGLRSYPAWWHGCADGSVSSGCVVCGCPLCLVVNGCECVCRGERVTGETWRTLHPAASLIYPYVFLCNP